MRNRQSASLQYYVQAVAARWALQLDLVKVWMAETHQPSMQPGSHRLSLCY